MNTAQTDEAVVEAVLPIHLVANLIPLPSFLTRSLFLMLVARDHCAIPEAASVVEKQRGTIRTVLNILSFTSIAIHLLPTP
jgi:hypothetical protein